MTRYGRSFVPFTAWQTECGECETGGNSRYGRLNSHGDDMGNQQSEKRNNNFIKFFLFFYHFVVKLRNENRKIPLALSLQYQATIRPHTIRTLFTSGLCLFCVQRKSSNTVLCETGLSVRSHETRVCLCLCVRARMWEHWNERTIVFGSLFLLLYSKNISTT